MTTSWATAARVVPGLEHDPCPGDVRAVRRLADDLRARADRVHAAAAVCRGWQPGSWRGEAANEAVAAVAALTDRLPPLQRSLEGAAEVLRAWAEELAVMQEDAGALGAATLELRRRQLAAGLAAGPFLTPTEQMLEHHRLRDERRALQQQVDDLHARWLAASRRRSADLDATAPAGSSDRWRGAWDLVHDRHQESTRGSARSLGWVATGAGTASTAVGLGVPLFAAYAPVALAASAGLGVLSTHAHVALAVGADGSGEAAAVSAAATVLGTAGGVVGGLAVRGGPVVRQAGRAAGEGADAAAVATEVGAALGRRGDGQAPGTVAGLDGAAVAVTVHDVDSPWHVGHGMRGQGFVGVAVVPVADRQRDRARARSR